MITDPERRPEGGARIFPEPARDAGSQEDRTPEGRSEDSVGGSHEWLDGAQHERGPSERTVSIAIVATAIFAGIACLIAVAAFAAHR